MQTLSSLADFRKEFPIDSRPAIGCLDIETTGLVSNRHNITLVGIHSPQITQIFVDTHNHKNAILELEKYPYLATFNGNRFDIPFLNHHYELKNDFVSVDLMYPLWELGYKGGLKRIEEVLGLSRMTAVESMHGYEAVELWHKYKRGDMSALQTLIKYNLEDIVSLEVLFNFVCTKANGYPVSKAQLLNWKKGIFARFLPGKNPIVFN